MSGAAAHVAGATLDWTKLYPGARRVPLPTYPFQRERFWVSGRAGAGDLGAAGLEKIYELKLTADETAALHKSSNAVKELVEVIKSKM